MRQNVCLPKHGHEVVTNMKFSETVSRYVFDCIYTCIYIYNMYIMGDKRNQLLCTSHLPKDILLFLSAPNCIYQAPLLRSLQAKNKLLVQSSEHRDHDISIQRFIMIDLYGEI